jgi:hypothetical protein
MTTESTGEKNATAPKSGSVHSTERRAENHPVEVAVFGGSRESDKRGGKVHGVGVGRPVGLFVFFAAVLAGWIISRGGIIEPSSGIGYYFGYVGGVMMLLMLLYPIRKHVSWARGWGPLRYWFMLHMLFGICGPTLVLYHSTFHVKSWNAGVAFYSMLLVAISGVIGRFIYKRIHQGMYGRKSSIDDLQKAIDLSQRETDRVSAVLIAATGTDEKLKHFRSLAFEQDLNLTTRFWRFITFDWRRIRLTWRSRHDLKVAVKKLSESEDWDKRVTEQHFRDALMYVKRYLSTVQRAAQFLAYERLFRLWHILHTPFVWLLGLSGIAHVIAVNMY